MTARKPATKSDAAALDTKRQELENGLKVAVEHLIAHIGGEGFLVELQTGDGRRYYLAFGQPETLREVFETLPADEPGAGPGAPPSIH
jgi:hypothetical protein